MKHVTVIGLDPGFASIGWCIAQLPRDPSSDDTRVVELGVFETKADSRKGAILKTDDNLRRAREIAEWLEALVVEAGRYDGHIVAVCAECFSPPRNAAVAAKVALAWGVIASMSVRLGIPIVQVTPQNLKVAITGSKKSSKDEVIAALNVKFRLLDDLVAGIPAGKHEHCYDAVGAVVACARADIMLAARRAA